MNRICLAPLCGFLGILVTAVAIPSQVTGQAEIPTEKLVNTLRLLNTEEYSYRHETGRFASREELLTSLRAKGLLSQSPTDLAKPSQRFASQEQTKAPLSDSPLDLENPGPYELAITTSADGLHYFVTLKPQFNRSKNVWECGPAAFSDDAGVIFVGLALGCEAPTR
jgi:hypothetical protein